MTEGPQQAPPTEAITFQGRNTLHLNQATICQAVERYLRDCGMQDQKVSSVTQPGHEHFVIMVERKG